MIILDTNIISEMMRPEPHPGVIKWIAGHWGGALYTTTITEAELLYGIAQLPEGRRRTGLLRETMSFLKNDLAGRILPFDRDAATSYATIASGLRIIGRGFDTSDIQIAAITQANGFALATRNTRHFTDCGIELIDPFTPVAGPTAAQ
ncbi:MAG: type II toxin-antitoxin system VapC family toxin [Alphaproteobacteria bacterium]